MISFIFDAFSDSWGMGNTRDERLDFFKGFLMLSVVFGHTINALFYKTGLHIELHTILRTFDMPMFMLVSGYLLKGSLQRHGTWATIANRASNVAFPAIIFIIITYILSCTNTYYFLWAIFGSSVIVAIAVKYINVKWLQLIFLVLAVAIFHFTDYRCMNMAYLMPFFVAGYYVEELKISKIQGIVATVAFCIALFFWDTRYTFWNYGANLLHNTPRTLAVCGFRFAIGILGSATAVFVLSYLYKRLQNNRLTVMVTQFGKETLAIYLMQYIIVEVGLKELAALYYKWLGANPATQHPTITGYIVAPVLAFALTATIYWLAVLLKKYKATRWLFGFKIH